VRFDLICCQVALPEHGPNGGHYLYIIWHRIPLDKCPVVVINVAVDFLDHSLDEMFRIWLLQGLLEIHNVSHHFSMGCNGISHAFLELEVLIMEEVLGRSASK
jgi:hypothetical protein